MVYVLAMLVLVSCENNKSSSQQSSVQYHPLHEFFMKEVDSLQRITPTIFKTVQKDNDSESKEVVVQNWEVELGAFLSVDLSKPVYRDAFEVSSNERTTRYVALDKSLDIQSVTIQKDSTGFPEKVTIERRTNNSLYQNQEKLEYLRNRYYLSEKTQKILLLGESEYRIEGKFSDTPK